ncbi:ubiquinol-cytochrome c reductase cytochrome b subunit [Arthrobacter sp. Leaf234]|uniref:cytochrome bc1 complex cytochrome b subunit n=1 Tax=Arthrobacter sp. Leaf234 TaxID=1736303 RepID=UPI0006F7FF7B|nr:ubiquinol-cytochrome c reductase cytochrome b subunit [Arthrobacter sp. Leaf234]KQO00874.1 ubiquinol-cytochrome c reductase cytochrome b subunit [Arthrobacter sp. Leaf234]
MSSSTATHTYTPKTRVGKVTDYVDSRVGGSGIVKEFGRKIFPDHWTFMFGEVALYTFVILLISGTFLTFFYDPSMAETHYEGSYLPLRGVEMSVAYASSLDISFDIRGGLFMRQIHHWAALLFVASVAVHMLRVFFTGAFRRPREFNWVVGCVLLILSLAAGFTGYSLPDDLLSGNGLRIIDGVMKAIPVVGTYLSFFLFGGEFPGTMIIGRLYVLHILLIPAVILLMIGIHLFMVVLHKHSQFPGPGRTNTNVVGYPVGPVYAAKAGGFFFIVFGVLAAIAAAFTINPIWNYGPYDPSPVSAGTQPDWYIGWVDGALRLMPGTLGDNFDFEFMIPFPWGVNALSLNVLIPALVPAIIVFTAMFLWPWIEAWVTKDKREHHLLNRPRNAPTRTAIGVAGITFYCVMWAAASSDLIATHFLVSLNDVLYWLRFLVIFGPILAFMVSRRISLALQRKDREIALHGRETGRIVRLPHGEFIEVHEQVDDYKRYKLTAFESPEVMVPTPDENGKVGLVDKVHGRVSRFFFEDRVAPVTPKELATSHGDHHSEIAGAKDRESIASH